MMPEARSGILLHPPGEQHHCPDPIRDRRACKAEDTYLPSNHMYDGIPTAMCYLQSLQSLRLNSNTLSGPFPSTSGPSSCYFGQLNQGLASQESSSHSGCQQLAVKRNICNSIAALFWDLSCQVCSSLSQHTWCGTSKMYLFYLGLSVSIWGSVICKTLV
ncbi:hypothetical protein SEVIR_8G195500v4 [Setaria viridis]|uniref:Leucine-rich repeat-containing N-terminal plant-type domain-containing protein n=1 Tax=Setaria viridis TaxID=4556 RepID=A0A4U6TJ08_SETVI|nr:uncharacterized protein LOC117833266 [Setaria viridis]TKW01682.1 hypothetical protein SEVIR_8G195500v2 [Setaria viridis]